MMVKILIADDHPIVASTLREMLSPDPGFHVLPPVSNSTELFKALETNSVDVLITDYCMPGGAFGDGLGVQGLRSVALQNLRRRLDDRLPGRPRSGLFGATALIWRTIGRHGGQIPKANVRLDPNGSL